MGSSSLRLGLLAADSGGSWELTYIFGVLLGALGSSVGVRHREVRVMERWM